MKCFYNYLEELKPIFSSKNTTCILDNIELEYENTFSIYDIVIAFIQGLYRNSEFEIDKRIKLDFQDNNYKLSFDDETIITLPYNKEIFEDETPLDISFEIPVLPKLIDIKENSSCILSTSLLVVVEV